MLILDDRGRRVGKIRYVCSLCLEDTILIKIWDGCIEYNQEPDDPLWEDMMSRTLTRAGYVVRK